MSEEIRSLVDNILSGEALDAQKDFQSIINSKINDRFEEMKAVLFDMNEAIEVSFDRHIRAHGKKPNQSKPGAWAFTHKSSGDVDYNNKSEFHQVNGKFSDAKESAKEWAKSHGHSKIYAMEGVEYDNEELDELSKKTLGSYVNKASDDLINKSYQSGRDWGDKDKSINNIIKGITKIKGRKTGIAKAVDKLTKENAEAMGLELSEEELDELSAETKKNYLDKAEKNVKRNVALADFHRQTGDHDQFLKLNSKALKRFQNVKKLTKENAEAMGLELSEEELDELSKKTLGSYINKASHSLGINAMNMGAGPNKALHPKDRDADYKKSRNTVTKRLKGLQNAAKQVTKENSESMGLELSEEELDELSKKTLNSYQAKATTDAVKRGMKKPMSDEDKFKARRRIKGLAKADRNLSKD